MVGKELALGFGVFAVGIAIGALLGVMVYTRASAAKAALPTGGDSSRLEQLGERVSDTRFHIKLNLWGVLVWLVLLPPTILLWRNSVPYVVFMSWYANFVGHISAYIAAKAEETVEIGNGHAETS
jgi:hypothetical protein